MLLIFFPLWFLLHFYICMSGMGGVFSILWAVRSNFLFFSLFNCCLFLVLRQNACKEVNTWTFIIHGLRGSHDQQTEGTASLSHSRLSWKVCKNVHRCDSSSIIKCSLAVGAAALSLCKTTDGTDEGFRVIKASRPFIVFLALGSLPCSLPCSKRVAMNSRANCTECTLIWASAPTSTTNSTTLSKPRRPLWTWASASRFMYYR